MSRKIGALCKAHVAYVYRTGDAPEHFIPRSLRPPKPTPIPRPKKLPRPPRQPPKAKPPRHIHCACGEPIWTMRSWYCLPHAIQARAEGVSTDRTALCLVESCRRPARRSGPLCQPHHATLQNFNMDLGDFLELQNRGACEICGATKRLAIDHDHACCPEGGKSCGKCVRGLLCADCNFILGLASDSPTRLAAAIEYLNKRRPLLII